MDKRLLVYVMTVSLLVLGCQTPLYNFTNNMYQGDQQLKQGQYSSALASFLKANTYHPSAGALAFAAMAAYKINDIPLADRYLSEAQGQNPNQVVTCIIFGYLSLVRFSQGNEPAGRQALTAYIGSYKSLLPGSASIRDVEFMAMSYQIDTYMLQQTIDRQIQELPIDYDKM